MIDELNMNKPQLIGILNITKESFSDGGKYIDLQNAITHVDQMILDGVDIIDIGAESTQPGFSEIDEDTQIERIVPIIKEIKKRHGKTKISIDTRSHIVAEKAIHLGVSMINDVSSGTHDPKMFEMLSNYDSKIILTHMSPDHVNKKLTSYSDIIDTLLNYFENRINHAVESGIRKDRVIVDPGISFGKSGSDNIKIIKNIASFVNSFGQVCLGVSRKRFSSKIFQNYKEEDLKFASLAITSFATYEGVEFMRVHDIDSNKDALDVTWKTIQAQT